MNQNNISRLERLLRETVEGSFGRLLGGRLEPIQVATRLVQAMEDSTVNGDTMLAYDVALNPQDYASLLEKNPSLAEDLADASWELGRQYGLPLYARPTIVLVAKPDMRLGGVYVTARSSEAETGLDATQVAGLSARGDQALSTLRALDAFLIVQGKRHVALDKPMITIGRRPDNDIVLEASAVSRQHAQIRWRFDRFVLYDVSNRGRTKVNGEAVSESILHPGDVISLSDVKLIYAEGIDRDAFPPAENSSDDGSTQIFPAVNQ